MNDVHALHTTDAARLTFRIGRGGISGWVKMWVCVGEEENRRGARGELEGRRRRRRGPNPFKADIIPRSFQLFLTNIFCHKSIPGFRSLWISLPQELGQVRDALRRRLLPPLLQLQEGVRAVHRQGDGDSGEDPLSLDVVLSNLQGRDPGSRSSLPSCALWQDDLGCNCH